MHTVTSDKQAQTTGSRQAKAIFFVAAFLSFGMSIYLFFSGDTDRGIYVGLWVPSILSAGNLLMIKGAQHD